ncbi:MAG TPA: hypothetical protein VLC49_12210, partial [Solirubrobacteraceae bacterium]|nr:hypothetical protein [Solirubrobacteraceae bacterium]
DGRGGSAMRLNFSGVGEDDIYEGIRRIGEVVREQVELYGTLTGLAPKGSARREAPPERKPPLEPPEVADPAQAPGASVLPLRRKRA